ncbi:hypothetical protein C9374_006849 [Naegleria lovaniensis]|uniref:CC2D2A N-terminal C2 domain-containing protein n=1 Tax=Naegleria lovaniensis TaxID=51637 RepID=A0AA88GYE0_NAELO|nr:uncharacterized protein C9374_006849 [Naegleria lovaniensis]KAG2393318.1 hypothetical protein C9374_006849 [Naegleria lovaniensis]
MLEEVDEVFEDQQPHSLQKTQQASLSSSFGYNNRPGSGRPSSSKPSPREVIAGDEGKREQSPLKSTEMNQDHFVNQPSRSKEDNTGDNMDEQDTTRRKKRKNRRARRQLFDSAEDEDNIKNDSHLQSLAHHETNEEHVTSTASNVEGGNSLLHASNPLNNNQDNQETNIDDNKEEDNNLVAKLLLEKEKQDDVKLAERKDPIIIKKENRKKDFLEHMTFVSEVRPVVEGVKKQMEIRVNELNKLHEIYLSRQKTKEAEECKTMSEKLRQKIEKLSQEYSTIYRYFDPQEEGIFSDKKPFLLEQGQHLLEHRLMREQDGISKFFDENGQLIVQLDPTNNVFTKPGEFDFDLKDNNAIGLKRTIPTKSLRSTTASKHFKIDIDIREIIFDDHPLMTEEEIVTRKILDAFDRYQELKTADKFDYYQKKILALQTELDRLRGKKDKAIKKTNPLDELSYLTKEVKEIEREMSVLRSEIKQARTAMENEEFKEITLVNSMISNWDVLCKIRSNHRYTVTNLKMGFRTVETNKEDDSFVMQYNIEQELIEMEEDLQWKYIQQVIEYREQLISIGEQDYSSLFLVASKKDPPKLPVFDKESERKRIIERMGMHRRYPGESIIIPEILKTEITKESELPPTEIERRNQLSQLSYHVNVLVNGNYVCKTTSQQLRSDFTVNFNEIVSVSVFKWPESISLEVMQSGWLDRTVSQVFVPVPGLERSGKVEMDNMKTLNFTSPTAHSPVWELQALGAFPLSLFTPLFKSLPKPTRHTSGLVKMSIAWVKPSADRMIEAPKPPVEKKRTDLPTARDLLNLKQITSWMESNNIDPNDPRNTGLLSMLNELDRDDLSSKGFYLAEQEDELFFFDDFNNSAYQRRLHLLKLRDEVKGKVPLPLIPLDLDQIQPRVVKSYEEKIIKSLSTEAKLSSYINQVRRHANNSILRKAKRLVKTNVDVSQFVKEPPLPSFHHSIDAILELFEEYRPLNPKRKQKQVPPLSEITSCNILVQITRGYNFPVRKDSNNETYRTYRQERLKNASELGLEMQMANRMQENGATSIYEHDQATSGGNKETINYITMSRANQEQTLPDRLLSFVAVTFDGEMQRTKSVEGPFPQYNQTLTLNLQTPNNDYSTEALKLIDKEIYFDVFDEITVEGLKDERDYNAINQRAEFKWLGSYSVPFSTLFQNGKIVGTFRLKTPPLYLGYSKSVNDANAYSALTVCITLDPPLPTPEKVEDFVVTGEGPEVYSYCQWWMKVVKKTKHVGSRTVKCLVPNIEGKATLITRYITPQDPPTELQTAAELARFVSLIPMVDDSLAYGANDTWVGSQEFLDTKAGDWEEHAILLCNYLLSIGRLAFVVLGKGVPEGETAYVLTVENNAASQNSSHSYQDNRKCLWLWNPVTGEKYSVDDPLCPLQEIHTIFSQHNVWVNVQKKVQPSTMKFDLNDVSQFYPLYHPTRDANKMIAKEASDPKGKIQYKKLLYTKTSNDQAIRLEQDIRRAIEEGFSKWRHKATIWDNSLSKTFKDLLQSFESSKKLDQPLSEENQQQALAIVNESSAINGFPLNFAFKDIKEIVTEVRNTMVYDTYENDVKFALAVYVEPYANGVMSVWVYVASVINKRGYY